MNDVDVTDQYRGQHRFDAWCRNNKWWMSLWIWCYGNLNVNCFHLHTTAHKKVWLSCNDRNSQKNLHSHYKFQHATALALIDPEGKFHDVLSYGSIKNFRNKRSATTNYVSASRVIETPRTSLQCIRVTDNTLNPDNGQLNIRLVKDLNHLPKPEKLADCKHKCCALHRYATGKQVRSRLICCSICNVYLCVSCYHIFHTTDAAKKIIKAVKKL